MVVAVGDEATSPGWVDAVLDEYQAHRSEVLSNAGAQQQALALGATAIGIVFAGAFNVWGNRAVTSVAFLGVVPLLCLFVLVQWVGQTAGLMRVGLYLQELEDALRSAFPSAPPTVFAWERTLAKTRGRPRALGVEANYEWHEYGALAIFVLLAYGSIALGAYRLYARDETAAIVLLVAEIIILTAIAGLLLREVGRARVRVRRSLLSDETA